MLVKSAPADTRLAHGFVRPAVLREFVETVAPGNDAMLCVRLDAYELAFNGLYHSTLAGERRIAADSARALHHARIELHAALFRSPDDSRFWLDLLRFNAHLETSGDLHVH